MRHFAPGVWPKVSDDYPGIKASLWIFGPKSRLIYCPYPNGPLPVVARSRASVNSLQLVTFERCRYSVPTAYVVQSVTLRAYVDRLEISHGDTLIASHPRLYEPEQESLQVEHYLELLDRRPGAVANARVFRHLAAPYQAFRQRVFRGAATRCPGVPGGTQTASEVPATDRGLCHR